MSIFLNNITTRSLKIIEQEDNFISAQLSYRKMRLLLSLSISILSIILGLYLAVDLTMSVQEDFNDTIILGLGCTAGIFGGLGLIIYHYFFFQSIEMTNTHLYIKEKLFFITFKKKRYFIPNISNIIVNTLEDQSTLTILLRNKQEIKFEYLDALNLDIFVNKFEKYQFNIPEDNSDSLE